MIRAGFCVTASWPIRTERSARTRSLASAALASSVWLVCRRRPAQARPGWDNPVLAEMRANIAHHMRTFWDSGIHGPDFVWAATGPALEAYSKHPVVKKANAPGETMGVGEFLKAVRRLVVEFVVGRVLGEGAHLGAEEGSAAAAGLDDVTTYYLLHRYDFKMNDAPAGACILYALSCNLSEGELADRYDILLRTGGVEADDEGESEDEAEEASAEPEEGSGSSFKLKPWKQRRRPTLGIDPIAEQARRARADFEAQGPALFDGIAPEAVAARSRVIPLIDSIHRLMHLWVEGDAVKVNEYLDDRGLRRSETFRQVLQALIELADGGSEERSVLESLSNHVRVLGERADTLFDRTRG
jgi:putative DNA methylase